MSGHADSGSPAFGEILVVTDAAPTSANALWRGALIAREHGASMRVLHDAGESASAVQAQQAIDKVGRQVQERLGIDIHAQVLDGELLAKAIAAAHSARLLVTGPRRASRFREWMSGTHAERLMRLNRVPTLVVRRPAMPGRNAALDGAGEPGRYGRVLVSVDLLPEAPDVISAAMAFSRDPQMQVLYALSAQAYRKLSPPEGLDAGGFTAMQRAQHALRDYVSANAAASSGVVPMVAFGHAADTVLSRERAIGAELVVIGARTRGLLANLFGREATRKVLANSTADVLVVPDVREPGFEPVRTISSEPTALLPGR
ncbi:universal stress protein [Caenimonas sp. SL110]|uniref:universal stress protein n=1 Tax=Caenimonas sp. SL110 TaxID=1450524 RepID=UPI0006528C9C|nr:universal stress protein [Caenimonas sp. SL110]